jgi:hypothetical protein
MKDLQANGFGPSGVVFCAFFTFAAMACAGTYSGGSGKVENPYRIGRVEDLVELRANPGDWSTHILLVSDIDMTGTVFGRALLSRDPIDDISNTYDGEPFSGVFDGGGHTISNLTISTGGAGNDYLGFIGYLTGRVGNLNLTITIATSEGSSISGGLAGYNAGILERCSVLTFLSGKGNTAGGLVGFNKGTIQSCSASGSVAGSYSIGGLIGSQGDSNSPIGAITCCYSTASVTGSGFNVGGLAGSNYGALSFCYSSGSVQGTLVNVGGLAGQNPGTVRSCFWNRETSGQPCSSGGKGLNSTQMGSVSVYQNAGWGGSDWTMRDGTAGPRLSWEGTGDLAIPAAGAVPLAGSGTEADPYQIRTAEEFSALSWHLAALSSCVILETDLDATGIPLDPIGDLGEFTGTFDGQGHVVHHVVIQRAGGDFVGVFSKLGKGGQIRDLGIENATIQGHYRVGGLVGENNGTVSRCFASGTVNGLNYVGGLAGWNTDPWSWFENSYAEATATGKMYVGGLIGINCGRLRNCYSTGKVSGTAGYIGGLIGSDGQQDTLILNCFWDIETSGLTVSAAGVGKKTAELQDRQTFFLWDPVWTFDQGRDYPRLTWENAGGWELGKYRNLSGGSGTAEDPFRIQTVADWIELTAAFADWDKYYALMADLDMRGVSVNPVAGNFQNIYGSPEGEPFVGTLEGNGHCIQNLTIRRQGQDFVGAFGYLGAGGQIRNLSLTDVNIQGWDTVGGLVAVNGFWTGIGGGTITSCSVTGTLSGNYYVGGLVGSADSGTISNCSTSTTVHSTAQSAGGLVGWNSQGIIIFCTSSGSVSGPYGCGGLVGHNSDHGSITASYAKVDVEGTDYVGGFAGGNAEATITSCYSTGKVTSTGKDSGGFIGLEYEGAITMCFWDRETSGRSDSSKGGKGLTSSQMKTAWIFQNAGWGLYGWVMNDGQDRPRLPWENTGATPIPMPGPISLQGNGTEADPYQIWTTEEFGLLSWYYPTKGQYFILMADLDLVQTQLDPIGGLGPFEGNFNGQDHVLKNIVFELPKSDFVGLFSQIGTAGQILNLRIENIRIAGNQYVGGLAGLNSGTIRRCSVAGSMRATDTVGGLAGRNKGGTIESCSTEAAVAADNSGGGGLAGSNEGGLISSCRTTGMVTGTMAVGGLLGGNSAGTVTGCSATCTVQGDTEVAGLAGYNGGTISLCSASGTVTGTGHLIGGLTGSNGETGKLVYCSATGNVDGKTYTGGLAGHSTGPIVSCFAAGSVSGDYYVGGLAGVSYAAIERCYATGAVTGLGSLGGLVGEQNWTFVVQCYSTGKVKGTGEKIGGLTGSGGGSRKDSFWDTQTSEISVSGAGVGKTTSQMKTLSTFTTAGWDLKGNDGDPADWYMPIDDYPKLAWEDSDAVLIPDLTRMTQANAEAVLQSSGLAIGAVTKSTDYSVPFGKIISQSPEAGYLVEKGYAVSYVVSLGSNIQGQGTKSNPYRIWNAADFLTFGYPLYSGKYWTSGVYVRLMNDLDLDGQDLNPIGTDPTQPFEGSFDGQGHTVRNPSMNLPEGDFVGLFGYVGPDGRIDNLRVDTLEISGRYYVGGLAGYSQGLVIDCHADGRVMGRRDSIGGLVGDNEHGTILQSSASGLVDGVEYVGGLVGDNHQGVIVRCRSAGTVHGVGIVGGLAGHNDGTISASFSNKSVTGHSLVGGLVGDHSYGLLESCYATGPVLGNGIVGGLAGYHIWGVIRQCYSAGTVIGSDPAGGLVGYSFSGITQDCFWDIQSSGQVLSTDGIGKTTAEMKTLSTFTSASWDFVGETANGTADVWRLCREGVGYPRLSWEFSVGGDFDCPDGVAMEDLLYLAERWMKTTAMGTADANADGRVDLSDFAVMAGEWNRE